MGLFDMISSAIREGKERVRQDTAAFADKISFARLPDACYLTVRELNGASLPMKGSLTKLIRTKIQSEEDSNELYKAFVDMYDYGSSRRNIYAMNISQWIGKKLDEIGDNRPKKIQSESDGKITYIPEKYHKHY